MEAHFSRSLFLAFVFFSASVFSQTSEIVKLLNGHLKNDLEIKTEYNHFGDTIRIVKPYTILGDILKVELEYKGENGHYIEEQEVSLNKITAIGKDINIILDTEESAVKINRKYIGKSNAKPEYNGVYNMFFTGIRFQKHNKHFGEAFQKAFEKQATK
ncbi:hypothetical protein [Epilithonimonas hispanica]|uniref:Uncharacterized protein n=1 Tax=Epilithonimonas hispanica TaxID=358687 RepID=A0A3D9CJB7_9FLAO|nr:hypothetical protein [Epilithonimonas hispanica]REC65833.1 hypothetical protein DRF58_17540 [Epilithonimonas hispanica]